MQRNDGHSPRVDDQRKQELDGFVKGEPVPERDDDHLQEEIGSLPGSRPVAGEPAGGEPSIEEAERRADFARWLRPSELPTTADRLLATARDEGAPDWVLDALGSLEPDRRFDSAGAAYEAAVGTDAPRR